METKAKFTGFSVECPQCLRVCAGGASPGPVLEKHSGVKLHVLNRICEKCGHVWRECPADHSPPEPEPNERARKVLHDGDDTDLLEKLKQYDGLTCNLLVAIDDPTNGATWACIEVLLFTLTGEPMEIIAPKTAAIYKGMAELESLKTENARLKAEALAMREALEEAFSASATEWSGKVYRKVDKALSAAPNAAAVAARIERLERIEVAAKEYRHQWRIKYNEMATHQFRITLFALLEEPNGD